MATIGYTYDPTHVVSATIKTWKAKNAAEATYSLGELAETDLTIHTLTTDNSRLVNRQNGLFEATAKARLLNTDKTTMLYLFGVIPKLYMAHVLTDFAGTTYVLNFGFNKFDFVSDADMNAIRYIDLEAQVNGVITDSGSLGSTLIDSWSTVYGAAPSAGTPNALDALYLLNSLPNQYRGAGFIKVETRQNGDSTWETMGPVQNGKIHVSGVMSKDDRQRGRAMHFDVNMEFDLQQTTSEMAFIPNSYRNDWRITLPDGAKLTFDDNTDTEIGPDQSVQVKGDMKNARLIHFVGKGTIDPTYWYQAAGNSVLS